MEYEDTEQFIADESEKILTNHTLIEREYENEINYYCLECDMIYASIEDFARIHQCEENELIEEEEDVDESLQPIQWETVDDLISEHDETDDEESAEATNQESYFEKNSSTAEPYSNTNEVCNDEEIMETIKTDEDITAADNRYYCYDCRTVFSDLDMAEQHDCPGIANKTTEMENNTDLDHKDEETEDKLYMCAYCEGAFESFGDFEKHQSDGCPQNKEFVRATVQKFQCPICLRDFNTVKALNSHSRTHKTKLILDEDAANGAHTGDNISCNICNTNFSTLRSLKLHMRIHEERPMRRLQHALPKLAAQRYNRLNHFFCEICNKSFDQNLLAIHKNMHQNVEEHICHICNRQFENKQSLEVHQQVHSVERNSQTPAIIYAGPTEAALRNIKNGVKSTHLANAKKTFPCQYCGHAFWRPYEKVIHERIHTGEKPYECEVCGKRFRIMYSLTRHLRSHTDIRPYVCSTCNKRFKSHSVYTHHLRIHLNERAYKCDICDKSFRTSVQLCGHRNSHIKPFNCTLCNRPFASMYAVKCHMKTHANNRIYENLKHTCNICGAVYARLGALRAHIAELHEVDVTSTDYPAAVDKQTGVEEEDEEQAEIDESALLLITAAADASSRQATSSTAGFEQCEDNAVEQEYLNAEELTLDTFHTEEVITGF